MTATLHPGSRRVHMLQTMRAHCAVVRNAMSTTIDAAKNTNAGSHASPTAACEAEVRRHAQDAGEQRRVGPEAALTTPCVERCTTLLCVGLLLASKPLR